MAAGSKWGQLLVQVTRVMSRHSPYLPNFRRFVAIHNFATYIMKASALNFLSLIRGPKQFVIPIYQRTYSWQIAHCRKLFQDILDVNHDESRHGHFVGSVVYFQPGIHTQGDVPRLLVIDGQQRLTTISLLIAALAEFVEANDVAFDTTAKKLRNYYLVNDEEEGDLHFKLHLTRHDKDTLRKVLSRAPFGENESVRVVENYEFFKKSITEENVHRVYNGIQQLFVVDVALEKDKDNPQLIFESLNSTGLDLSQADLIRNFMLMGQPPDRQTELYERYWFPMEQSYGNDYAGRFNWFIRDYLTVNTGRIPVIGRVYDDFKEFAKDRVTEPEIEELVADIFKFSAYYVDIVLHKTPDDELRAAFKNISKLKVDVSYPFLLFLYADFQAGVLSRSDLLTIIHLIESYVLRRAVCGIPTNSMNKTFGNLHKSVNKENYVESVEAAFQLMRSYQRFPNDAEFETELLAKDLYSFRPRNYFLNKLENDGRKEVVNTEALSIEHIMPQNTRLSAEWKEMLGPDWAAVHQRNLHKLGNLTLTGYNPELSDRPFSYKKAMTGGFNDSPLRLNEYVRQADRWTEQEIETRARHLAKKAKTIWAAPNLPDEVLGTYRPQELQADTGYALENFPYLKDEMLDLFNQLRLRILNIDPSVREEFKKLYIAYKSATNFVDIVPLASALRLSLNMSFDEVHDPKGMCRDLTGVGRWGNGDVEAKISSVDEIDDAIDLIQQAFDVQVGNP